MRVFFTHTYNFDSIREVEADSVGLTFVTYSSGSWTTTLFGIQHGDVWHTDEMSAAKHLRQKRQKEIDRLRTEADRLEALPDPIALVVEKITAEAA